MTERKAVIKNADMSEDTQQDAVDSASQALEKFNIEKVKYFVEFFYCSICACAALMFAFNSVYEWCH